MVDQIDNATVRTVEIILPDGSTQEGAFQIWDEVAANPDLIQLTLVYSENEIMRVDEDEFSAMCAIRRVLETDGITLSCYGASLNVYPSTMSRTMGSGSKGYKLTMGQQAQLQDLVSIFDTGSDVLPATVDAQKAFYEQWLDSLKVIAES